MRPNTRTPSLCVYAQSRDKHNHIRMQSRVHMLVHACVHIATPGESDEELNKFFEDSDDGEDTAQIDLGTVPNGGLCSSSLINAFVMLEFFTT